MKYEDCDLFCQQHKHTLGEKKRLNCLGFL